jgi:hypothetical protein
MQQDPAENTRWLTGTRLRELLPTHLRSAIDTAASYPCPWRDGTRTQVVVWNLSTGLFVEVPPDEWDRLAIREFLVE